MGGGGNGGNNGSAGAGSGSGAGGMNSCKQFDQANLFVNVFLSMFFVSKWILIESKKIFSKNFLNQKSF